MATFRLTLIAGGVDMKLITWNIQWGRGADGRVDLDRVVAHAQRFADFEIGRAHV